MQTALRPAVRRQGDARGRQRQGARAARRRRRRRTARASRIPVRPNGARAPMSSPSRIGPLDQAAQAACPDAPSGSPGSRSTASARASQVTARRPGADAAARARFDCRSGSAGLNAGEEARVTVAAVDVGILNLTRYVPPDPVGPFLRPAAALDRDPRPLRLSSSTACRARAARSARAATGRREARGIAADPGAAGALFSGVVEVGPDGTARGRTSTSRPSTARRASWRWPGRRAASAAPSPT